MSRLPVPVGLSPVEAAIWRETVAMLPDGWFNDQGEVLARFCAHVAQGRCLQQLIAETDPRKDLRRYSRLLELAGAETARILSCARSLRITLQSRTTPHAARARAEKGEPVRDIRVLLSESHAAD